MRSHIFGRTDIQPAEGSGYKTENGAEGSHEP
jgi:hypothetical protein